MMRWWAVGVLAMTVTGGMLTACGGGGDGAKSTPAAVSNRDWDVLPVTASTQMLEGNNLVLSSRNALGGVATQPFLAYLPGVGDAFSSSQADLVINDSNSVSDIFRQSGATLQRLSIPDDASDPDNLLNRQANGSSGLLAAFPGQNNLSRHTIATNVDNNSFAFVSDATNLAGTDLNGVADVYVRYIGYYRTLYGSWSAVPRTYRASVAADGSEPTLPSFSPAMLGSRSVAFVTASSLVAADTNGTYDVYLKNLDTGNLTLISRPGPGQIGNGASFDPQVAGRFVFFLSWASNLDSSDNNGALDLFVYDSNANSLKRLPLSGTAQGDNGLLGAAYAGQISFPSRLFSPSRSGRYVAFLSESTNLVAGDNNGRLDAFVLDIPRGLTVRVSSNATGSVSGATLNGIAISTGLGTGQVLNGEHFDDMDPEVFFTSDQPYFSTQTGGNGIDVYGRAFFNDRLYRLSNTQTDSWPITNVDYLYGAFAGRAVFAGSASALGGGTITGLFSASPSTP